MEKKNVFISRNTVFGLFVGLSFILASFLFYKTGRSIVLNPQLNNVMLLLTIAGAFIGVRKYREEQLQGAIGFGAAFGGCIYIIAVGVLIYGIYAYNLYSRYPELQTDYLAAVNFTLEEVYKGTPMLDTMKNMMATFISPLFIALSESFNKLLTGLLFSLLLAGILRRKKLNDSNLIR